MEYFIDFNHDKIKVFYDYKCVVVVRGSTTLLPLVAYI
jgi:hypothetical protein